MQTGIVLIAALMVCAAAFATEWNVTQFGAVGDGKADNTAAFQAALDKASASGGGVVNVPAGQYRFAGVLSIPGGVTLQGTFRVPPTDQREDRPKLDGSVLMAYAGRGVRDGEPFIRLAGSMATLAGFLITYPEWRQSDVPPIPYPATVRADGGANVGVLDCCFISAYEAVYLKNTGRFLIRNVYGYPSFRGLYVDNCLDIGRVENCHFWPFGVTYQPKDPYCEWVNLNGVAFEFARTDWQYMVNTFCFGYGVGYKFSTSENGSCNGNFLGIGADSCQRAVLVDTAPGTIDLLITNGEFVGRWTSNDSVGVEVVGRTTSRVGLTNCAFWGPLDRCIWLRAHGAALTADACGFNTWDVGARNSAAVQADGGRLILQGNTFRHDGLDAYVGERVISAILMGNQAEGGFSVDNRAGTRTQLLANEEDSIAWTKQALRHYRVNVGALGDSRYVLDCHTRERAAEWADGGTKRWTASNAQLVLPVLAGTEYTLSLEVFVPRHAVDAGNGIYLGEERLAALPEQEGPASIVASIPKQKSDKVRLIVRAKGWIPASVIPGSTDTRELGLALRAVTMKARRAPARVFDANRGVWLEGPGREEAPGR
jgi:hypothetical protein